MSEANGVWKYDQTVYTSRKDADEQFKKFRHGRYQLLIQFVEDAAADVLATAHQYGRRILISVSKELPISLEWKTLSDLAQRVQPKDQTDVVMGSLTPTVLHELLHIICPHIVDIGLFWPHVPPAFDERRCSAGSQHPGPYRCYGDYECRMLAAMARASNKYADELVFARNQVGSCAILRNGPLDNAESITRTLCSMYLSYLRPELDFVPDRCVADGTIHLRSSARMSKGARSSGRREGKRKVMTGEVKGWAGHRGSYQRHNPLKESRWAV